MDRRADGKIIVACKVLQAERVIMWCKDYTVGLIKCYSNLTFYQCIINNTVFNKIQTYKQVVKCYTLL